MLARGVLPKEWLHHGHCQQKINLLLRLLFVDLPLNVGRLAIVAAGRLASDSRQIIAIGEVEDDIVSQIVEILASDAGGPLDVRFSGADTLSENVLDVARTTVRMTNGKDATSRRGHALEVTATEAIDVPESCGNIVPQFFAVRYRAGADTVVDNEGTVATQVLRGLFGDEVRRPLGDHGGIESYGGAGEHSGGKDHQLHDG